MFYFLIGMYKPGKLGGKWQKKTGLRCLLAVSSLARRLKPSRLDMNIFWMKWRLLRDSWVLYWGECLYLYWSLLGRMKAKCGNWLTVHVKISMLFTFEWSYFIGVKTTVSFLEKLDVSQWNVCIVRAVKSADKDFLSLIIAKLITRKREKQKVVYFLNIQM